LVIRRDEVHEYTSIIKLRPLQGVHI